MIRHVESIIVRNDICHSCGVCEVVCPKNCIDFSRMEGQYLPQVNENSCIECGICLDICSGYLVDLNKLNKQENHQNPINFYLGNHRACYIANAKNEEIRNNGVSGGCITALVKELLDTEEYDGAFLVDSHEYNKFVQTNLYKKGDNLDITSKSRYLPVSHSNMIKYVLKNRDARVIIVATSCAVHGFLNVVDKFKLNRDNYLILGLFCDRTMNYNIYNYFNDYYKSNSRLKNLFFRTKESGGWPGQIKLEYESGVVKFLPAKERMILKDYFQLERCMYCIDKLNQFSDISIGDNYTGNYTTNKGNNSVIIRTSKGKLVWNLVKNKVESKESSIQDIYRSQQITLRSLNYRLAKLKQKQNDIEIYTDCPIELSPTKLNLNNYMKKKLKLINISRHYETKKMNFHIRIKYEKMRLYILRIIKGLARRFRFKNKGSVKP